MCWFITQALIAPERLEWRSSKKSRSWFLQSCVMSYWPRWIRLLHLRSPRKNHSRGVSGVHQHSKWHELRIEKVDENQPWVGGELPTHKKILKSLKISVLAVGTEILPSSHPHGAANSRKSAAIFVWLNPIAINISSLLSAAATQTETRKTWCVFTWPDTNREHATGNCDLCQAFGNVQVWMGNPQGPMYKYRQARDFISFMRSGFALKVFPCGKPASETGDNTYPVTPSSTHFSK